MVRAGALKVCAITNVYNEHFNLPLWLAYYGRQLGARNCIVVDHGSDRLDGITDQSILRTPRSVFDDRVRARTLSSLTTAMLEHYDVVIYTDCDEFLLPDPARYDGLRDYFARTDAPAHTAIGLDVIHDVLAEPPIDPSRPILDQRAWVQFNSNLCKTLATREPIRWGGGFHASSAAPAFDDLYLLHLKCVDLDVWRARAAITREIAVPDPGQGPHHRQPDGWYVDKLNERARYGRDPDLAAVPGLVQRLAATAQRDGEGLYAFAEEIRPHRLMRLPGTFEGRL
jgi:hypothetical protein